MFRSVAIAFALVLASPPSQGAETPAHSGTATAAAESPQATDAAEADRRKRLEQAAQRIDEGRPREAIALIDGVIAEYETRYPDSGETRWYVAQTTEETLAYLARSKIEESASTRPRNAATLTVLWVEAYYMKGYALVELSAGTGAYKATKAGGTPDSDPELLQQARAAFERGLQLEPYHARTLSELGNIQQVQHDWEGMLRTFTAAEEAAAFSPASEQNRIYGRAKRGVGYALIELGRLDEAEAKYRECLKIDPSDATAKDELDYIRRQRAKH